MWRWTWERSMPGKSMSCLCIGTPPLSFREWQEKFHWAGRRAQWQWCIYLGSRKDCHCSAEFSVCETLVLLRSEWRSGARSWALLSTWQAKDADSLHYAKLISYVPGTEVMWWHYPLRGGHWLGRLVPWMEALEQSFLSMGPCQDQWGEQSGFILWLLSFGPLWLACFKDRRSGLVIPRPTPNGVGALGKAVPIFYLSLPLLVFPTLSPWPALLSTHPPSRHLGKPGLPLQILLRRR